MSLQTAILNETRTLFQTAHSGIPVDALEVSTRADGGVALKSVRVPSEYGYGKSQVTESALLTFTIVTKSVSLLESILDTIYDFWEQKTDQLTSGSDTYRIRQCLFSGEDKGGGEGASERYEATQTYEIEFNRIN